MAPIDVTGIGTIPEWLLNISRTLLAECIGTDVARSTRVKRAGALSKARKDVNVEGERMSGHKVSSCFSGG